MHPFARVEYRELRALQDVSFDVRKGEFFGIVGRNGSGKSTLLKILASIYRADAGTIRMAGRLAPFIELGVGFDPELTARENVVLNGVMMGLSRREARPRLGRGARLRRAPGVRRAEAEELLLGDDGAPRLLGDDPGRRRHPADRRGAGGRRCRLPAEVRRRLPRDARRGQDDRARHPRHGGRCSEYCHRAMLLDDGELRYIGDPEEAARRYLQAELRPQTDAPQPGARRAGRARRARAGGRRLARGRRGRADQRTSSRGSRSGFGAVVEARARRRRSRVRLRTAPTPTGSTSSALNATLEPDGGDAASSCEPASGFGSAATIENPLTPGRYCRSAGPDRHGKLGRHRLQAPATCSTSSFTGPKRASVIGDGRGVDARGAATARSVMSAAACGAELREVRGPSASAAVEAVLRPALPDRGHRVQEDLLRDGARLRLVAAPAADAVRGAARRLHADLPHRLGGHRTIRSCCSSTSSCSASSRRRPTRP